MLSFQLLKQRLHWPVVCALCSCYHRGQYAVCERCFDLFLRITNACRICCVTLPDNNFPICGSCIKEKPSFDQVLCAWRFVEPLRCLLHEYKYTEALYLRSFLVKMMLEALPADGYRPDCLVPVPLHSDRLRQRGFNQAGELARVLARHLKVPVDSNLIKKHRNTVPQVHLNRKQRQKNLRQAFSTGGHDYQHVTLIDDLMTTGSTANEIAMLLKRQGVARVDVWCCARR